MRSSHVIKVELDAANAVLQKAVRRTIRKGGVPSAFSVEEKAAKKLWREWSDALDVEAGRAPRFQNSQTTAP